MEIIKNKEEANNYWDERFTIGTPHHSDQNSQISIDFINKRSDKIDMLLLNSNNVIEIGGGTGELSYFLSQRYSNLNILGTDLSQKGIDFANSRYKGNKLSYEVFDCMNQSRETKYDIAICSNTLEHFINPYTLIDSILQFSDKLIILVPYNQPVTDGYSCEGGAGHVFQFTDNSFDDYQILEWYTFSTSGWQHSSNGETPLQLCVVISKK